MISNLNEMNLELLSQEMLETRWQAFPQSLVHSLQEQNKIIITVVTNGLFKLFYKLLQSRSGDKAKVSADRLSDM